MFSFQNRSASLRSASGWLDRKVEALGQLVADHHAHRVGGAGVPDDDLERGHLVDVQDLGRHDVDGQADGLPSRAAVVGGSTKGSASRAALAAPRPACADPAARSRQAQGAPDPDRSPWRGRRGRRPEHRRSRSCDRSSWSVSRAPRRAEAGASAGGTRLAGGGRLARRGTLAGGGAAVRQVPDVVAGGERRRPGRRATGPARARTPDPDERPVPSPTKKMSRRSMESAPLLGNGPDRRLPRTSRSKADRGARSDPAQHFRESSLITDDGGSRKVSSV